MIMLSYPNEIIPVLYEKLTNGMFIDLSFSEFESHFRAGVWKRKIRWLKYETLLLIFFSGPNFSDTKD